MHVARTVADFRAAHAALTGTLGLVPTMGYLHEGHRSLMRRARAECDAVAVSIFVNPTQFGPNDDFDRYPRDEEHDLAICREEGVSLVLMPPVEEIYPEGATTTVSVGPLSTTLEGAARPGHFDGVTTVVSKLFAIVQPERAYFGQKDAQQLMVIRRMSRDLLLPLEVVGCPTVREPDGLALSSRNVYLSPEERAQALSLSRGLRRAEAAWADGVRDAEALRALVREEIEAQPLARIDYVSLAEQGSLAECAGPATRDALLSLAVRFGKTRLIDNVLLAV
ncbi:MAG: pantoate--beta-alanine ligase [Chloroflexi bacterium HGW-Chloroflexi-9]|nr:MAG: pantoate--beta-alanine ligase [Chloroflexi bacterium HGW-Chloroflexi-9]